MSNESLDFLTSDNTPDSFNDIPAPAVFTSSFVGAFNIAVRYRLMSRTVGVESVESAAKAAIAVSASKVNFYPSGVTFYYFDNRDAARASRRELEVEGYDGRDAEPQTVLTMCAPTASLLNVEDKSRWGSELMLDLQVSTLNSEKQRHIFHAIALPAAVYAVAKFQSSHGKLKVELPDFNLHELNNPDTVFDDAFQLSMIGNGAGYAIAKLYQRRAKLWEALGESDWKKQYPKGYVPPKNGAALVTESPELSRCLRIFAAKSPQPLWLRVTKVLDPRVDALNRKGERLDVPIISNVFVNQAEAQAFIDVERAAAGLEPISVKSVKVFAPSAWAGNENGEYDTWVTIIKELGAELTTIPSPTQKVVRVNKFVNEMGGCTKDDVMRAISSIQ